MSKRKSVANEAVYATIMAVLNKNPAGIGVELVARLTEIGAQVVRDTVRRYVKDHYMINDRIYVRDHPLNQYLARGFKPLPPPPAAKTTVKHKLDKSVNVKHELRRCRVVRIQSSMQRLLND